MKRVNLSMKVLVLFVILHLPLHAFMSKKDKIWVAGHTGLAGSAILEELQTQGYEKIIVKTHEELDLCDLSQVREFFREYQPDYVFLCAAKVGGILANNTFPAEFINVNLAITRNVLDEAYKSGVKKLLFLGSSCIYPRMSPQPIQEEYLLTGPLEVTNEWYAIAKIAGLKMCQAYNKQYGTRFISLMPTNLYGPRDHFSLHGSHVAAALIRKFVEAKEKEAPQVVVWGSGTPRREFLYVEDLAQAAVWAMNEYEDSQWLNVGVGEDVSIKELAEMIREIVQYEGEILFDTTLPDGTPRKLLDVSKIHALCWKAKMPLEEGLRKTIQWYQLHKD